LKILRTKIYRLKEIPIATKASIIMEFIIQSLDFLAQWRRKTQINKTKKKVDSYVARKETKYRLKRKSN
jgi:hypothetical protein